MRYHFAQTCQAHPAMAITKYVRGTGGQKRFTSRFYDNIDNIYDNKEIAKGSLCPPPPLTVALGVCRTRTGE